MNSHFRFLSVMAGAVLLLGLLPLFEKQAVEKSDSLLGLVIAINLVTIAVLALPGWKARPTVLSRQWFDVLLIGLIASGIVVLLNIQALETTSATHRSVYQSMYPAATAIFSYFVLRERLHWQSYLIIGVMVVGIIVMSSRGVDQQIAIGDLLLLATLPLMGFCDTWVRKSLNSLEPAWVALCRFVFGTVLLLAAVLLTGQLDILPGQEAWLWILLSGLCIGSGILLLYKGMALRGASLAAAMIGISPVITLALEALFLDQGFTGTEIAGMALVVSGAILLSRPRFQHGAAGLQTRPGIDNSLMTRQTKL